MADDLSVDSIFEKAVETSEVKKENDVIVLALHASLLAEGFMCISTKEEEFELERSQANPIATPTEPGLPEGWNESADVYVLQYRQREVNCLVKVLLLGDQLLINAISSDKLEDVHTLSLQTAGYLKDGSTQPVSVSSLRNVIKLFSVLNKEIVNKLKRTKTEEKSDSSAAQSKFSPSTSKSRDKEREETGLRQPRPQVFPPEGIRGGDIDPFGYGAGDLSPFGGSGGMIMDPLRERGRFGPSIGPTPPGFHPPGARYDPVFPFEPRFHPGAGQYRGRGRGQGRPSYGPDPDHLPPPGYDDMFS